jgi:hypothetical protein
MSHQSVVSHYERYALRDNPEGEDGVVWSNDIDVKGMLAYWSKSTGNLACHVVGLSRVRINVSHKKGDVWVAVRAAQA